MNKSYMANNQTVERKWYLIDAEDLILGRLATEAATILRGKHKPTYTPHVDCGDYVVVVNAEKVALSGNKLEGKIYYRHSGYAGGLKKRTAQKMLETQAHKLVELAIKGMLPKTKLGEEMYRKLFVYCGPEHPHQAQKPEVYKLKG